MGKMLLQIIACAQNQQMGQAEYVSVKIRVE